MRQVARIAVAALMLPLLGCGQALTLEQAGASMQGVYRIETHTLNDAGCDEEGASVLSADAGYLALFADEAMGEPIVRATGCTDPHDCRTKAGQSRAMQPYWAEFELVFTAVEGGASLSGEEISTGSASSSETDPCYGTVSQHELTNGEGGLRIEQRSTAIDEFPKEGRRCTGEGARAVARSARCNRLRVITAVREGDLDLAEAGS